MEALSHPEAPGSQPAHTGDRGALGGLLLALGGGVPSLRRRLSCSHISPLQTILCLLLFPTVQPRPESKAEIVTCSPAEESRLAVSLWPLLCVSLASGQKTSTPHSIPPTSCTFSRGPRSLSNLLCRVQFTISVKGGRTSH